MVPAYRQMILEGELTPVSKLSAAFLKPRSAVHLQFAYYESSLVVQFLVERFGFKKLVSILRELGEGAEINQTIEKNTVPMEKFEEDFAAFAKQMARNLAPGLDWSRPREITLKTGVVTLDTIKAATGELSSNNFWLMTWQASQFIKEHHWSAAKNVLEKLLDLYPEFTGPDSAYRMLATVHRMLGETNQERQVLTRFAELDGEACDAYLRLMELATAEKDWPMVVKNARRYLAVDPLVAPPYRFLAQAAEQTGDIETAIGAYQALLQLDPQNPAEIHFRLAQLLHRRGTPDARRHVLQALENAPRFRAALKFLLELNSKTVNSAATRAAFPEATP